MDSSGMRKRVGLILERCDADLEKLIREDSENGQSCRAASQACSAVRHLRRYNQASLKWVQAKAAKRRYWASPQGKAARRRYDASPKGKAAKRRYDASPKGKVARRRYQASPKGKAAQKAAQRRYEASPKGKATLALRTARRASAGVAE